MLTVFIGIWNKHTTFTINICGVILAIMATLIVVNSWQKLGGHLPLHPPQPPMSYQIGAQIPSLINSQ